MSQLALVIGGPGDGKTAAARTLDPRSTFFISISGKRLPWQGSAQDYKEGKNYLETASPNKISSVLQKVDKKGKKYKTIVIDDVQYLMSFEFMDRIKEKGWDKFSDIAYNFFQVLQEARDLRDDLVIFVICHTDVKKDGRIGLKTVGNATDQYVVPEGLTTLVLHTEYFEEEEDEKDRYQFRTQRGSEKVARSPMGMFDGLFIPNDLGMIRETIDEYYDTGIDASLSRAFDESEETSEVPVASE